MNPLIFIHIPKTAGTTLHKIITQQYSPKSIHIRHDSEGETSTEWREEIRQKSQTSPTLILGHLSVGLHETFPTARYITCLRDPVSRIISHYRHAHSDSTHYLHHAIVSEKLSLSQYASSGLSGELSDGMTRMLSGISDFHKGEVTEETFAHAVSNLENLFTGIIPSERFDEGILLLARDLGWKTPYYLSRKIGRNPYRPPADPETVRSIEEHNQYDRRLYDLFSERFAQRADSEPNLPRQLARFRKLNPTYGKAVFLRRELQYRIRRKF